MKVRYALSAVAVILGLAILIAISNIFVSTVLPGYGRPGVFNQILISFMYMGFLFWTCGITAIGLVHVAEDIKKRRFRQRSKRFLTAAGIMVAIAIVIYPIMDWATRS